MTEVWERHWWHGDLLVYVEAQPTRAEAAARQRPSGPPEAVDLDDEVSYEQWIGLLYACAVFRGVLTHPPPWIGDRGDIGYVLRVDP